MMTTPVSYTHLTDCLLLFPKKAQPFWEPYNFYGTEELTVVKHAGGMFYRAILDGAAEPAIHKIPHGGFFFILPALK